MDQHHKEGITRRDLMKVGAASAAACVAGSQSLAVSSVHAAEPTARRRTRFLLDCHAVRVNDFETVAGHI